MIRFFFTIVLFSSAFLKAQDFESFVFPCVENLASNRSGFRILELGKLVEESGIDDNEFSTIESNFSSMTYYDLIKNRNKYDKETYFTFGLNEVLYPFEMSLSYNLVYNALELKNETPGGIVRLFIDSGKSFIFFVPPNIHDYPGTYTAKEFTYLLDFAKELKGRGVFVFGAYDFHEESNIEKYQYHLHEQVVQFVGVK